MVDTQSVKIQIPENLSDIEVGTYKKFIMLANEYNGDELALHYFCGINPAMQEGMMKKDLDEIREQVGKVLQERPALIKTFTHNNKEYGFHPKLEDISMGEYVDLDQLLKEPYKNAEKVMGVLYRPITRKMFGKYDIESYDPDVHDGRGFDSLSADIFLGCLLFFYRIELKLQRTFLLSLVEEGKQMDSMLENNFPRSGAGMEPLIKLLEEICSSLTK